MILANEKNNPTDTIPPMIGTSFLVDDININVIFFIF